MKRAIKISLLVFSLVLLNSCVTAKVYRDLEEKHASLTAERDNLTDENQELSASKNKLTNELSALQKKYNEAASDRERLRQEYTAAKTNLGNLQEAYNALEKNSSSAIAANVKQNRALLAQLEEKERKLKEETQHLAKLKKELDARSKRVNELETVIASKDAAMKKLKNAISKALLDFEGNGLTVEQRDGKVYVSMENKLLFKSGSWVVGEQGARAVRQLGTVLATNPEISVLIEGHTDNVKYSGSGQVQSNWDLSVKRATAVVAILRKNAAILPENLTAAGRGEFAPIASNTTATGKAKNRRIEVILTPKLDEVTRLLNDM